MNGCIIPEENERCVKAEQENATFLVIGDEAYTSEIIEEYNRNAEAKTKEFNDNAVNKTNAFNTNATNKTNDFNTNYNNKVKAFNDNATQKTEDFDANANLQTNNFNSNAIQKTEEFNQNALSYREDIDENKENIVEVSNRLYRIENDLFDSGEASGTSINLQDSTLAEFKEVSVDGVCKQMTTNGNQLIDVGNPSSKSATVSYSFEKDTLVVTGVQGEAWQTLTYDVTDIIKNNSGKTIKYKNKSINVSNQDAASVVQIVINYNDGTAILYFSLCNLKTNTPTKGWIIPSDTSNIERAKIAIYTNNSADTTIENTVTIKELLLYFDNNDTYEPYTGTEPSPSQDYKQPIEVITEDFDLVSCGKNLYYGTSDTYSFTTTSSSWHFLDGQKGAQGTNLDQKTLYKGKVKKGETYTFKVNVVGEGISNMSLVYDNEALVYGSSSIWSEYTFTAKEDGYVILRFYIANNSSVEVSNVQLEQNSSSTEYEPYKETKVNINVPENEFVGKIDDTYKDQFKLGYNETDGKYHLYLDKRVGKIILNGSENWGKTSETINVFYVGNIISSIGEYPNGLCDYFQFVNHYPNKVGEISIRQSGKSVFLSAVQNSVEEFKSWLAENNVTVYYVLAEPYSLDLGVVNMPLSYHPITNVYTTCSLQPTIEVEYYRDFKNTIAELQNNQTVMQAQITSNTNRIEALETAVKELQTSKTESEVVE